MVIYIKQSLVKISAILLFIILMSKTSVNAKVVSFERDAEDETFEFEVEYDEYLANNQETTVYISITLPINSPDLTDARLTNVGVTVSNVLYPSIRYFTGSFEETHDFLDNYYYSFSLAFTPSATAVDSPDGYFTGCIISLTFYIALGYNGLSSSIEILYSPGLVLQSPSGTDPTDPTTPTDPTSDPSDSSTTESFIEKNGLALTIGGSIAVIGGLIVLISKGSVYQPPVSTKSQEFTKKRTTEKLSRRERKRKK